MPAAGGGGEILLEQELIATDEPGEIHVVFGFSIPEAVAELSRELPAGATADETDGFAVTDDGETYEWDGRTSEPTLSYTVGANRTFDSGGLLFADTGSWALVERPRTPVRWAWTGGERVTLTRSTTTETGSVGAHSAFLGESALEIREVDGETITLVAPSAASLAESPDDIHAAIADVSGALRVGGQNEATFVVAAPVEDWWGVRGLQFGDSDVWVRADSEFDADNVWVHEYVHTRQTYNANDEVRWFTEGTAVYYAALLTFERGDIDYEAFAERLERGEASPHADDVLAEPDTWTQSPDYHKGALVAAAIDREIRLATDGERDLQDVFRAMNDHDGEVGQEEFLWFVEDAGGPEVREVAREYTETEAGPTMWDEETHEEAFGLSAPRMEYAIAETRVEGDYRNGTVEKPVELVPGERLIVTGRVTNAGDAPGEYETRVTDGEAECTVEGRLESGESESIAVERTFEEPGEYEIRVAEETLPVRVVEPATATVTDVEPNRTTVGAGESIGLTATVENRDDRPGIADLELVVDDEVRDSLTVRLDAGETTRVTLSTAFDEPGEYELRGGEHTQGGTVESSRVRSAQAGVGVPAAIAALVLGGLIAARRR
ncbi:MAG: hypothetical protein QXG03_09425 [Halalkalicoccus sp.]